jgi:hypothetical protein
MLRAFACRRAYRLVLVASHVPPGCGVANVCNRARHS